MQESENCNHYYVTFKTGLEESKFKWQWRRVATASELIETRKLDKSRVLNQNRPIALMCCLLITANSHVRKQSGQIREHVCKSTFINSTLKLKELQAQLSPDAPAALACFKYTSHSGHEHVQTRVTHTHGHLWCSSARFIWTSALRLKRAVLVCWRTSATSMSVTVLTCMCAYPCMHLCAHVLDYGKTEEASIILTVITGKWKTGGGGFDVSSQRLTNTERDKPVTVIARAGHSGDLCVFV